MYVYRFENPRDKKGPYCNSDSRSRMALALAMSMVHSTLDHPESAVDCGVWTTSNKWVSACPSIQHLLDWFNGFIDDLFNLGYWIAIYYAEEVTIGKSGKQLVMKKSKATLVDCHDNVEDAMLNYY